MMHRATSPRRGEARTLQAPAGLVCRASVSLRGVVPLNEDDAVSSLARSLAVYIYLEV